jgi:hypothetical protein
MFSNTRWSIGTRWRLGYTNHHGYETNALGDTLGKCNGCSFGLTGIPKKWKWEK